MGMHARASALNALYSKRKKICNFEWNDLTHYPISYYLSQSEVGQLRYIATSPKLGGTSKKKKFAMVDNIMRPKGFIRMTTGTNRMVYRCDYDQSFLLKVAIDDVGIRDSPAEFFNQEILKPFVPKVFDVTPCGTVGMFERVEPITSRHEFHNIASEVYELIVKRFIGRFVLEDIGTEFFKNWGVRDGFGPVLLDFPYLYEIDGNKLTCTNTLPNGCQCGGLIDYDDGFNTLVCEQCHQRYTARSLGKKGAITLLDSSSYRRNTKMAKVGIRKDGVIYGWNPYKDDPRGDSFIRNRPNFAAEGQSKVRVVKGSYIQQPVPEKAPELKPEKNAAIMFDEAVINDAKNVECCESCSSDHVCDFSKEVDKNEEFVKQEVHVMDNNFAKESELHQAEVECAMNSSISKESATLIEKLNLKDFFNDKSFEYLAILDESGDSSIGKKQKDGMIKYLLDATIEHVPDTDPEILKNLITEYVDDAYRWEETEEVETETEPEPKQEEKKLAKDLF